MGKEGAAALADLLRGSGTITDVNINMNDVGNDGAFQVGGAQWMVQSGQRMACAGAVGTVGKAGVAARQLLAIDGRPPCPHLTALLPPPLPLLFFPAQIAAAISGKNSLKLLDVGGNNISEDGAKALACEWEGAQVAATPVWLGACRRSARRGHGVRACELGTRCACHIAAAHVRADCRQCALPYLAHRLLACCVSHHLHGVPATHCSRAQGQRVTAHA